MVKSIYRFKTRVNSIIPLTGGFGNQLFQFAFGTYIKEVLGFSVKFDSQIGNPRRIDGKVSLFNVESNSLPEVFEAKSNHLKKLFSKSFGWNLSKQLNHQSGNAIKNAILKFTTMALLCIRFKGIYSIKVNNDLGFDDKLDLSEPAIFLGYFQTYVYAESPKVLEIVSSIRPKNESERYKQVKEEILKTNPLLAHVRLTDYLQEDKFGIPSKNYYRNAIEKICKKMDYKDLWIFSDDIGLAGKYLDGVSENLRIVLFDETEFSDIEVWNLMRHFSGYVISNSTFAWWAAFLRGNQNAPVYAPQPWFRSMNDPKRLLPEDWIRVSSL